MEEELAGRQDKRFLKGWTTHLCEAHDAGVGVRVVCALLMGQQGRLMYIKGLLITIGALWSLVAWSQVSDTAATDCEEENTIITQSEALPIHL